MNLNWSNRVIKYVLFIFNLLFVISGIIMIAVGVSVKEYYTDYDIFLGEKYFSLPNLLIAIGSLIFFISFFGCCGAIRESWFMIFVFSILLSLIFILEFSAGIAGYVLRDDTASYLTDELEATMSKYDFHGKNISKNSYTYMWDTIQEDFQCCGASGPEDWTHLIPTPTTVSSSVPTSSSTAETSTTTTTTPTPGSPTEKSTDASSVATTTTTETPPAGKRKRRAADESTTTTTILPSPPDGKFDLPLSCCRSVPGAVGTGVCNLKDTSTFTYYTIGCVEGFGHFLKDHAVTLGGVGIAIAIIQLFGVIFACHLARQLKHGFYST